MLTMLEAVKKHLLSHTPEEEWLYKHPICRKKFQARADIPNIWKLNYLRMTTKGQAGGLQEAGGGAQHWEEQEDSGGDNSEF